MQRTLAQSILVTSFRPGLALLPRPFLTPAGLMSLLLWTGAGVSSHPQPFALTARAAGVRWSPVQEYTQEKETYAAVGRTNAKSQVSICSRRVDPVAPAIAASASALVSYSTRAYPCAV